MRSPADTVTDLRAELVIAAELRRIKQRSPDPEADYEDAAGLLTALRRERLTVVEADHGLGACPTAGALRGAGHSFGAHHRPAAAGGPSVARPDTPRAAAVIWFALFCFGVGVVVGVAW